MPVYKADLTRSAPRKRRYRFDLLFRGYLARAMPPARADKKGKSGNKAFVIRVVRKEGTE